MLNFDMAKYGKDRDFNDPVVRCDGCQKILYREELAAHGMCIHCGSRRVRNCLTLTIDEFIKMKNHDVDPAFLALFEEVADE